METPFETWLIGHIFEAEQTREAIKERWTGLYFLASEKQTNLADSLLERLILPDNEMEGYRLKMRGASVEHCKAIIEELFAEFERQTAVFNPAKQFQYYQNHD